MRVQTIIYLLPLAGAAAASVALVALLLGRRPHFDVRLPVAIVLLALGWTFGYAMEIVSVGRPWKMFWATLQFPFIAFLPVAWAVFAVRVSGARRPRRRWQWTLLLVIPVLIQPVIWTNESHHWFWREIGIVESGGLVLLNIAYGPAFWLLNYYSIALVVVGSLLFLFSAVSRRVLSRFQRFILVAIPALPAAANIVYTTRSGPLPHLDLTPFAFLASAMLLGIAFIHYRLERLPSLQGLARTDRRLHLALRAAKADSLYWDLTRRKFLVDDHELGLFGGGRGVSLAPEEMRKLVHPDDRGLFAAMSTTASRLLDEVDGNFRVIGPDGAERRLRFSGVIYRAASGRAIQVSGLVTDITEEHSAALALQQVAREAEGQARTYFDSSAAAMWSLDGNGRLTLVNEAACHLLECERDAVIGSDWIATFVDGRSRRAARARFEQGMVGATPSAVGEVTRIRTLSGATRYIRYRQSTLTDSKGQTCGVLISAEDLTDLLRLEQQLHQSTKLESLGRLSGGVAHDFNNLLMVIRGNAELIQGMDHDVDDIVSSIITSADRGARLSQRLLAFARRQSLRPRPTDINIVIGDLAGILRRTLPSSVRIEAEQGDGDCTALVDRAKLESAVLNLALNASDAMDGSGRLSIGCHISDVDAATLDVQSSAGEGPYVRLIVADDGCGMAPEVIERAFEPFYTTKDIGQGSGLGLSMVLGFVQQSGGFVTVDSAIDAGSSFSLYLPYAGPGAGTNGGSITTA